ncbi:MAG TPA: hypothetical protein VFA85_00320 [Terriglobales bacterium]|nr:hypothetical protein [Terriglobales bacterium]
MRSKPNAALPGSERATILPTLALLVLIFTSNSVPLRGQEQASPAPQQRSGLQLLNVSGYAAYYSNGLPTSGGLQPGTVNLASDVAEGGSALIGWSKFTDRSTFAMTYSPSYTGRVRYSSLDALNHAFSLNTTAKIAPRWTFSFSVRADLSSLEQILFSPTTLSNVASTPATFDNLSAAVTGAKFTNPQLAAALTSAPLVESPLGTLLYGQRMFTSGAQTSLSYSASPRLSITFEAGGNRTQHVSESNSVAQNTFLVPDTTSGTGGIAVSYSLSPFTQLGGSVNAGRISSRLYDFYTTTSLVTLGHTFGRRWFMQVHGGVGVTNSVQQTFSIPSKPLPAGGGSLGFKTLSSTVLGSFDRSVSDSYGLGAASTSSATVAWRWARPNRAWSFESSVSWQQLQGNTLANTSGWQLAIGAGRKLGPHLALLTQYTYLNYSGGLTTGVYSLSQSAARVSLVWSPQTALPQ